MKKLSITNHSRQEVIAEAVKVLKQGGVIVYPTETAYGLGADFLNSSAVKKVYRIKGRGFEKKLSVLVGSLSMAKKLVGFNRKSLALAGKYWPGPLTLVLPRLDKLETLGARLSSNKLATAIVRKLNRPLTSTSANFSGKPECYSSACVKQQFKARKYQPDLIIDAGRLPRRKVSTVVQAAGDGLKVLRRGKIIV